MTSRQETRDRGRVQAPGGRDAVGARETASRHSEGRAAGHARVVCFCHFPFRVLGPWLTGVMETTERETVGWGVGGADTSVFICLFLLVICLI